MFEWMEKYDFFQHRPPVQVDQLSLTKRLQHPSGPVDVVLDTDAYNEIDDQYALAYLALNPEKLRLKAICAAPFCNQNAESPAQGMQKSYEEIHHILSLMGRKDLQEAVYRGAEDYLVDEKTPRISDASEAMARLAMAYTPENPLYVVAIGAITNVASALIAHPEIRDRLVLVWLGGHALHWHDTQEFNMMQDVAAARVVLGCGMAVVLLPCMGVVSAFATTEPELRAHLEGKNALCDYLLSHTVEQATRDSRIACWSRVNWDVTAVAWLLDGHFMEDELIPSPIPEYDYHWAQDQRRHPIRYVYHIHRDSLFEDLFRKLAAFQ